MFNKKRIQELEAKLTALEAKESEGDRIKKEIQIRAMKIAEESYNKELMFQQLTGQNMNYAIIQDLIKAANFVGKVTVKLDGNVIVEIEGKPDYKEKLNTLDEFYSSVLQGKGYKE